MKYLTEEERIMKFLRGVLLSVSLLLMAGTTVFAEGATEYSIDEIGIKFEVPSDILSYTRTSGISDDVMKALGYSTEDYKDHLISTMEEEDTYLIAFDANVTYRVYLESVYSSKAAYSMKTDEEIIQLIDEGLDGELTEMGTEIKEKSVFSEGDRKFAVVELTDSTGDCCMYATVEDHQAYYFYIRSYSGGITDAHRALIKQIAGSSEFFKKTESSEPNQISGEVSSDSGNDESEGNVNFISLVIRFAAVIVGLFIGIVILIMIVSKLLSRNKKPKVRYSTRRDMAYEERLKRIMGDSNDESN